ncbi:MAG: cell wall hydrolase [Sphingomicrobium sp.]|nr:cell wall hydrolase [Sphingomonadales bacterium]
MTRFLGMRGVAALGALLLSLIGGSTAALGQVQAVLPTAQNFNLATQPVAASPLAIAPTTAPQLPKVQAVLRATLNGAMIPTPAAPQSGPMLVMQGVAPAPTAATADALAALIDTTAIDDLDAEATCLATAVYFESKGEPLDGQLAVAQVVINRTHSGRYPPTLCGVVKQHAQFSFVRGGAFPHVDANCAAWRKARAIARIAQSNLVAGLPTDVLWYHADYVTPRWREALVQVEKIGAHIFYRA